MREETLKSIDYCMRTYNQRYGGLPNAVVASDPIVEELLKLQLLRSAGKAKKDYSGIALHTGYGPVPLYFLGRFTVRDIQELGLGERGWKSCGGNMPIVFARQHFLYQVRRIFGARRFKDSMPTDLGVSITQLEQQLARQEKKR